MKRLTPRTVNNSTFQLLDPSNNPGECDGYLQQFDIYSDLAALLTIVAFGELHRGCERWNHRSASDGYLVDTDARQRDVVVCDSKPTRKLPLHAFGRQPQHQVRSTAEMRVPESLACASVPTSMGLSLGSGITRAQLIPAPTSATCGVMQAHCWRLPPLPGESSTGWQQVNFGSPVAVTAGTTYVASYFAPSGHYSLDQNFFTTAGVDSVPLHALANGVDGSNGVFAYAHRQHVSNLDVQFLELLGGCGFQHDSANRNHRW